MRPYREEKGEGATSFLKKGVLVPGKIRAGAVYSSYGFPAWIRILSTVDAFQALLFKNRPLAAVAGEFACIFVFAAMILALATALFLRTP